MNRHSTTATWVFPPERQPRADRTNLKELAARPERFEHHLIVVAKLGCAQLEIATASEPLYFAHINISDEYAVALPTGDPLLDAFPMRTFVSDPTGADVGRYNHRAGDLVLHPHGFAHWPGKLRPPYQGLDIPPGMRRCGVSLVYCASVPTPSTAHVVPLPAGRKRDDVKAYAPPTIDGATQVAAPTLSMADLFKGPPGVVARIGNTELELVDKPISIAPPRGGWVVILTGDAPHAACDLIRVAPGTVLAGDGIERALVLSGEAEPEPVPPTWTELSPPPFARYEDAPAGTLPFRYESRGSIASGSIEVEEQSPSMVIVKVATTRPLDEPGRLELGVAGVEVPRYWLARMLFRVALHDLRLNYVETYNGFFIDDSGDDLKLGVRALDRPRFVTVPRADARALIERLYRAVAPPGYTERLA
jgi:hypothetical protein